MPLQLPNFSQPYFEQISVCAMIAPEDAEQLAPTLDEGIFKIARFQEGDAQGYVVLVVNRMDPDDDGECHPVHFHLDASLEEFFSKKKRPDEDDLCDLDEIIAEFQRWVDLPVKALVDSRFTIPLDDLPRRSIIGAISEFEVESSGLRMQVERTECKLHPPPLRSMSWYVRDCETDDLLVVDIDATINSQVSDSLLSDAIHDVLPAFVAFVLGEPLAGTADEE